MMRQRMRVAAAAYLECFNTLQIKLYIIKHSFLDRYVPVVVVPFGAEHFGTKFFLGGFLLSYQCFFLLLPSLRVIWFADINQCERVQLALIIPLIVSGDLIAIPEPWKTSTKPVSRSVRILLVVIGSVHVDGFELRLAQGVITISCRPFLIGVIIGLMVYIDDLWRVFGCFCEPSIIELVCGGTRRFLLKKLIKWMLTIFRVSPL
jgi:hypothetical protein